MLDSGCSELLEDEGDCYLPAYVTEVMCISSAEDDALCARQRDFLDNAFTCGKAGCGPTESWFGRFLK